MSNKTTYAMRDDVWNRVVQIVQEAMITGVDCTDLLRQVRVQVSVESGVETLLELTPEYRQQVKAGHDKLQAELDAKRSEAMAGSKFITEF